MEELQKENQYWKISGSGGGGKGGGGGGGGPTEEPDTLRSTSEASIVAALCEGEVKGFPGEAGKFIFLDETPLIGSDGNSNFNTTEGNDVEVAFATGTQSQQPLSGFSDVRIEQSLGVKLTKRGGPVSLTTTRADLTRIIIRMGVGSLFTVEDDGDIKAASVDFNIQVLDATNGVIIDENQEIEGKSRGPFEREYFYVLGGTGPWTVRVTRKTDDPEGLGENNDLYFKAIVGVLDDQFSYPNTAVIGMKFAAESFSSVPRVSVELEGMKVRIPSGVSAGGVWGGGFSVGYSTNPAWILFDLMTNERYGAGQFIDPASIDIYSLREIAAYCDETVDGEPRFSFNGVINNRGEAFDVLNSIAAAFRGMIYYAQGQIVATQDRPGSVTHSFNSSNVIVEVDDRGQLSSPPFVYEGTSIKARKTVALVSWNDKDDGYRAKVEYVEDRAGLERYGYREVQIRALGTTSRSQARRIGFWTLQSNLNETETVTFKVGAIGFDVMPGEIISITDPYRSPGVSAGLISSATTSTITLDRDVDLAPNVSYQVVVNDSGTESIATVTNTSGTSNTLDVTPAFSSTPQSNSSWIVRESSGSARLYRVIGVYEENFIVTITATAYHEGKYGGESMGLSSGQLSSVASSSLIGLPSVNPASIQVAGNL